VNRLLLPVAAMQGKWMRATIRPAPPAAGPTSGTVGATWGAPLRIAVVGESTAAGSGVDNHDEGFTGCLAREINAHTGRPVQWQVAGQFGATARRIRYRLLPQLDEDLDAAVLLAGGNDVMTRRSPDQWRDDLSAIVDDLTERAGRVVVAGIPPFALFPSMPATLGRYLSERAAALDDVSRQICAAHPGTTWVTMPGTPPPYFFASDRFHLSAAGYQRWSQVIADHLVPWAESTGRNR
jgi:lysophospholipase L1-like esterase